MRRIIPVCCVLLVSLTLTSPPIHATPRVTITVSAAASLTDVLPVISNAFNKRFPHITVKFNFGGSNALVEQLRAGAPVDVLATASESTMLAAVRNDWAVRPMVFSKNSMAIVTPTGNPAKVSKLSDLQSSRVLTAVCAKAVPCGEAAARLFARNNVTIKPVTNELDVRGVLGKVLADQVDAGIVYLTDARAAGRNVTTVTIPLSENATTSYLIAPVTYSRSPKAAKEFVDFVRYSSSAQRILRTWGFAKP